MKKLLIAAAAMAVVAGAQAQSSVSVYGIVDVNVQSSEADATGVNSSLRNGNGLSTSRLGFRGTEDLGGGLKAEFQLEAQMDPQTGKMGNSTASTSSGLGDAQFFNREAWVGLSDAKLGSIRIGTTDTSDAVNIDATVSQFAEQALISELGTDKARTIRYTTPTFNGFSAQYGHSQPDATATGELTANSITSAVVKYEVGNTKLYAGMESKKLSATFSQDLTIVGGSYNFGPVAVGAVYATRDGADGTTPDATKELKQTRLTAAAPVAALGKGISVHAGWLKNESATIVNTDYTEVKFGLTKAFSNRTTGYVVYSKKDLELDGADSNVATVGIRHVF
jgi:predicted porin